jgi:hypothetical protein
LVNRILQGLEGALRAAARLGRIGRNVMDAQMLERAPDLRQARPARLPARLRRMKIMRAPVGVEAQRQAVALEHFAQAPERRGRALLLDQKGRKNRARRIVHRHDQIRRRLAHQPRVTRTVLMQHHAGQRTARPSAPMRAAPLRPFQQTFRLQKRLRPAVAPPEIVALRQLLVKVLGRKAVVALAIQSFHFLLPIHRNPPARRLAQPAVQQARLSVVLEAQAPASKRPLPDPEQLRRFQLTELRSLVATQNIPELDHTNPLEGFRPAHPTSPKGQTLSEKRYRTDRVLPKPDISCASDKD